MNGNQQNNARYLPNIRINILESNVRGNRVPGFDESSHAKRPPTNPPSSAPSVSPSSSPTEIPIEGEINIFFSIWFGKQEYTKSVKENNDVVINSKPSKIIRLPVYTYTPFNALKIVEEFMVSFDYLRGNLEHILCRGTEFQIIENHITKRNICDRMQGPAEPQVQAHMRGDRSDSLTRSIDDIIKTTKPQKIKSTIILSNDADIMFDLKDEFDLDTGLTWIEFKVTFPVVSTGSIYDEISREEKDIQKLENSALGAPDTSSIAQVEKIANKVVDSSIMDGEFEHMFRHSLRSDGKGDLVVVASPIGKEGTLFIDQLQNITKLMVARRGTYPHPLERSYYSTRQIIGASLILGTFLFTILLMKIATRRQKKRKRAEKWDSVNHCENGLLRSHTGLDYILNLNVNKHLEPLEEGIGNSSSSEVTGSEPTNILPDEITAINPNNRFSTI